MGCHGGIELKLWPLMNWVETIQPLLLVGENMGYNSNGNWLWCRGIVKKPSSFEPRCIRDGGGGRSYNSLSKKIACRRTKKQHSIKYIFSISSATHFPLAERWIFPKQFRPWRFFSYKKASALSRGCIRGIKGGYLNINTPDMITRRRREKKRVFFSNLFFF